MCTLTRTSVNKAKNKKEQYEEKRKSQQIYLGPKFAYQK